MLLLAHGMNHAHTRISVKCCLCGAVLLGCQQPEVWLLPAFAADGRAAGCRGAAQLAGECLKLGKQRELEQPRPHAAEHCWQLAARPVWTHCHLGRPHTNASLVQLCLMQHRSKRNSDDGRMITAQVRRRKPAQQAALPQLRHAVATERDGAATPTASPPAAHAT